jgi:hypothetical protein
VHPLLTLACARSRSPGSAGSAATAVDINGLRIRDQAITLRVFDAKKLGDLGQRVFVNFGDAAIGAFAGQYDVAAARYETHDISPRWVSRKASSLLTPASARAAASATSATAAAAAAAAAAADKNVHRLCVGEPISLRPWNFQKRNDPCQRPLIYFAFTAEVSFARRNNNATFYEAHRTLRYGLSRFSTK